MLARKMDEAWDFVMGRLYDGKTRLIYDFLTSEDPDGNTRDLPTPEEIARQYPNPCGWGTGMEDSVLSGGTMLDAVLARRRVTGEDGLAPVANDIMRGLLSCVTRDGFVARSLSPVDGSCYANSSRDQYTHFLYAAVRMWDSPLCEEALRPAIRDAVLAVAHRCVREVTAENGYALLRADGRESVVTGMWGDLMPHEALRLPMVYLAAYHVSKAEAWKARYLALRDVAIARGKGIAPGQGRGYIYLQMQYSLRLLYDLDEDASARAELKALMHRTADIAAPFATGVAETLREKPEAFDFSLPRLPWRDMPLLSMFDGREIGGYVYRNPQNTENRERAFYPVRETGEALTAQALAPDRPIPPEQIAAFTSVAESLDLSRHATYAPLLLLSGYWLTRETGYC